MPTEETNSIFYICTDDEHCTPLSDISDASLTEEEIKDMEYKKFDQGGEITFEINPPQNHRELKTFIEIFHPNVSWLSWWLSRYGSNNWRRFHGLPMSRKLRK